MKVFEYPDFSIFLPGQQWKFGLSSMNNLFLSLPNFLFDLPEGPEDPSLERGEGRAVSSCQTAHCLPARGRAHGKSCCGAGPRGWLGSLSQPGSWVTVPNTRTGPQCPAPQGSNLSGATSSAAGEVADRMCLCAFVPLCCSGFWRCWAGQGDRLRFGDV